jgi:hypothetical protein
MLCVVLLYDVVCCIMLLCCLVCSYVLSCYLLLCSASPFLSFLLYSSLSLFPTLTLPSLSLSLLYYYHLRLRLTSALYPAYSTLLLLLLSTLLPLPLPVQLPSVPPPSAPYLCSIHTSTLLSSSRLISTLSTGPLPTNLSAPVRSHSAILPVSASPSVPPPSATYHSIAPIHTHGPTITTIIATNATTSCLSTICPPTICALLPAHPPSPQIRTAPART